MIEERRIEKLSLWLEPQIVRGGIGNKVTTTMGEAFKADIVASITRKSATKLFNKEVDLEQKISIPFSHLPDDIKKDLKDIWNRIEAIL